MPEAVIPTPVETSDPIPTILENSNEKPPAEKRAKTVAGAMKKRPGKKPVGRPKGAKDSPSTDRQVEARERAIRVENAERDKELLKAAEVDPSLREWTDLPPEAGLPVYDLIHSSIQTMTGLPGLVQDPQAKLNWSTAFVGVCNYYKFTPLSHPLVALGFSSFICAMPTIQAYKTLKKLESAIEEKGKDSAEVKTLLEELKTQGVTLPNA